VAVVGGFRGLDRWSDEYEVQTFHFREMCEAAGTEHPLTLTSMSNPGEVLNRRGKYEQAEEMHRQALGLRETVLGQEHPSTLTSMNNLASVLGDQAKYEKAEEKGWRELMEKRRGTNGFIPARGSGWQMERCPDAIPRGWYRYSDSPAPIPITYRRIPLYLSI
jgi:hypothetical protein